MAKVHAEPEWRTIYVVVVALCALAFLYSVKTVLLAPVVGFLVLLLLISPWSGSRQHLLTVCAASALLIIWLVRELGGLLAPFILAFVLAYILDPLVDRLEKRMKRGIAVAVLAVPAVALIVLIAVFGVPALIQQVESLVSRTPQALQSGVEWLQGVRARLLSSQLPLLRGQALQSALDSFSEERVAQFINEQQAEIGHRLWHAILGVGKGVTFVLGILGYLVLTPVLTVYLLLDFDKLIERAGGLIPRNKRATWVPFIAEYNGLLSRYLRGQIIEATLVGTLTWLGLMLLGFPYSALVGAVAGVFNLIPYLGLIVSIIPAVLIALLSGDVVTALLKVAGVFVVVQTIDSTITGPRIVGGSVGLHPVWVILAIAVGSYSFGFVGLLLSMPAAVFIKLVIRNAVARYRESRVYEGETLPAE